MTQDPPPELPDDVLADGALDVGMLGRVEWFTDVGHVRSRNEDRLLVRAAWGGDYLLLLVADGAGGHDGGDKAAEAVISTFHSRFPELGAPPEGEPAEWLRHTVAAAHRAVRDLAHGQPRPPASTGVGLLIERASLCGWRFHVGDSRLYVRTPDGEVGPWTRDHNIINGLIDRGLPEAQAMRIADGGRLTQVLGGTVQPEPDLWGPIALAPGTSILLCSDGAYGYNRGRDVLAEALDPAGGSLEARTKALKDAVLGGDAPDNATAVLWEVPAGAVGIRTREAVAQRVRGPDAAALADRAAHDQLVHEGKTPADEEPEAPRPSLTRYLAFSLVAAVVLVIAWRALRPAPTLLPPELPKVTVQSPAPTPADRAAEPLPWPADERIGTRVKAVVRTLDNSLWSAAAVGEREEWIRLLGDLVAPQFLDPVVLSWVEGPARAEGRNTFETWPLPGGANADRAGEGWAARGKILALHPTLATQTEVAALLRESACRQVELRWPRLGGAPLPSAEEFALWIAGCLPSSVPGASVSVRLGAWPDLGWSREDFQEVEALGKPGAYRALAVPETITSPRVAELAILAQAIGNPALRDIQVQVRVVLPGADGSSGAGQAIAARAQGWATGLANLIRAASGAPVPIQAEGVLDEDPLVEARLPATLDQSQLRHIADLNRRVEIVLSRGGGLEPDEGSPAAAQPPPPATTPPSP